MEKKALLVPSVVILGTFAISVVGGANSAQTQEALALSNTESTEIVAIEENKEPVAAINDVEEAVETVETPQVSETSSSEPTAPVEPTPAPEPQPEPAPQPPVSPERDTCSVSWHDNIGDRESMQNGQAFDANAITAAHRSLPLGSTVTLFYEGKELTVTITDRTSQSFSRCLDVTSGAFSQLAALDKGLITVEIVVN